MTTKRFSLEARVSTEDPEAVRPALGRLIPSGTVVPTDDPKEFVVSGELEGESARDLNRSLLSSLRRIEKRTRLRSEWTCGRMTEHFFDYVPKGKRTASVRGTARP